MEWAIKRLVAAEQLRVTIRLDCCITSLCAILGKTIAVEPFPVVCETCHARLKVRSESVIGEVHGCPKCGSMVHIVPPVGWKAGAEGVPVTMGVSSGKVPQVAPTLEDAAEMLAAAAAPAIPAAEAASPRAAAVASAHSAAWSPLVLCGVIGTAVLVGSAIAMAVWPEGKTAAVAPSPAVTMAAPTETSAQSAVADQATSETSDTVVKEPWADDARDSTADEILPEEVDPSSSTRTATSNNSANVEDSEASPSELPPANDESAKLVDEQARAEANAAPSDQPAITEQRPAILRFDPLDFDPAQLSLRSTTTASRGPSTASGPEEGEAASTEVEEADVEEGDSPLPPPNPAATVRLGAVPAEAANRQQVAQQLALQFDAFEIPGVPLARFLDTLSDLAGVPITLDPVALELSGVSPQAVVSMNASKTSLEKLLRDTLAKQRLGFIEREGHVVVTLPDAERRSTRDYEVSDLLSPGDTDSAAIGLLVETFVAPATWQAVGGAGTMQVDGTRLRVDQVKRVQHELLIFCERLRVVRGLKPKSRYPVARLSVDSPYRAVEAKLGADATFTFLPWARLDNVVRHWQDAAGVTILVDWRALADVQLGPATPIACSAVDRTWNEAFSAILEPLSLGWYAVDAQTIEITSRDAFEQVQRVEFYSVPASLREQFASGKALVESLRGELQEHADVNPTGAKEARMQLDVPSGRLIVRGTPATHRYLAERLNGAARQ